MGKITPVLGNLQARPVDRMAADFFNWTQREHGKPQLVYVSTVGAGPREIGIAYGQNESVMIYRVAHVIEDLQLMGSLTDADRAAVLAAATESNPPPSQVEWYDRSSRSAPRLVCITNSAFMAA